MYKISHWASRHPWLSRILIIVILVFITELALFTGSSLQLLNLSLPLLFFYAAVVLFLSVFLLYPDKRYRHRFPDFYRYQKTCDGILLATTFCLLVCVGNRPEPLLHLAAAPAAAAVPNVANNVAAGAAKETSRILPLQKKLSKKAVKQALAQKIKLLRKAYKNTSTGGKVALVILSVVVAVLLLYLLAALSCSIACSGAEGLAVVVLLLGTGVVVFFLVRVIRRITKGPRHKRTAPASTT